MCPEHINSKKRAHHINTVLYLKIVGKERMKKRGDQTLLSSLFFWARLTRQAYLLVLMGEPNKNLLFTAPLNTATQRKEVGLTHTFSLE
jgi:hypothetical protein